MPRDDWKKARNKDTAMRVERDKRRSDRLARPVVPHVTPNAERIRIQSPKAVLWFGKHKGKTIQEADLDDPLYIDWLAGLKLEECNWKMRILVEYLNRGYKRECWG